MEEAHRIIAANLEHLTTLQQQLNEDRLRLSRQQRRSRRSLQPLNATDVEQHGMLSAEVNELRRRQDMAHGANELTERRIQKTLEDCDVLQKNLQLPPRPEPGASPTARRRPASAGARVASSGGGLAEHLQMEEEAVERELEAAELKLAKAAQRRDSYEHMAARCRLEEQSFDPRFNFAQAELRRETKRVAQLRIAASDASQDHTNAEAARRSTERQVALLQRQDKEALTQQQAALLSTQQSVLHFEVSRMSRSQSAIRMDPSRPADASGIDPARAGDGSVHSSLASLSRTSDGSGAEPIELIHKALAQLESRAILDSLDAQTTHRLSEAREEIESLARRTERTQSGAAAAAAKRLERLHELVGAAERELAHATARLETSNAAFATARRGIVSLDGLAKTTAATMAALQHEAPYTSAADPAACDASELPGVMQDATDILLMACMATVNTETSLPAQTLSPTSPSTLAPPVVA